MSVAQTGKPVKIAWLTPVILHEAASFMKMQQAEGGTWLDTLFDKLREDFGDNAEFIVIHPMQSVREVWRFERGNVEYVLMPRRKYGYKDNFGKEVAQIADILNEVQPDLLHIHGTEEFYGLVSDRVSCNSVISLQGFRDDIWRCYFTDISMNEYIWLNLKARKTAFIREISYYKRMVQIEKQVLAQNRYYIGRTQYDRMHSTGRNPRATYFGDCHDILREAFYKERWKLEETLPFSIHTTMTERPYKGILLLIQAVDILRRRYPQVKMFVAGSMKGVLGRHAQAVVKQKGLQEHVIFLGRCSSEQISQSMKRSRVFVLGSYVENESLSLQEAQAMGMPCVAPAVGGLPSMFTDGKEGFFYSTGDAYYAAGKIGEIFDDEALAEEMGENARRLCLERNNPDEIGKRYRDIYEGLTSKNLQALVKW